MSIPSIKGSKKFPYMVFLFLIQKIVSSPRFFPLFCDIENLAIRKKKPNLLNLHWKKKNPNFPWAKFCYCLILKMATRFETWIYFLKKPFGTKFLVMLRCGIRTRIEIFEKMFKKKKLNITKS